MLIHSKFVFPQGNDDIYVCVMKSNGQVEVEHMYSTGRSKPQVLPLVLHFFQFCGKSELHVYFFVNSILLHKLHLRFMCVWFQQGNVYNITTSLQNSVISCVFTTTNTISIEGTSGFNQSYYLLFSYGPSNNGNII